MNLETIAAIATALGEASISVVRISGPDAKSVASRMVRTPGGQKVVFEGPRRVLYGKIVHPTTDVVIDEGIVLWMPGPRSYTAEDVVELQVHGGIQLVQTVLEATLAAGARLAEPGEFTKRAFLNGRIDLSQAEAVIDLIRAKTDFAGRVALQQVQGRFSEEIRSLRRTLIELQAHVEVTIDYPEHDVESVACQQVLDVGAKLMAGIDALLEGAEMGRILRDGVATAIVGRPNVGKSSLLNALLRRDRAIVTDIPGTTRDVLEEYVNVRGIPLKLIDTAGIRETSDVVERIGVDKSRQSIREAELVLVVLDGTVPLTPEDEDILKDTEGLKRVIVVNKMDAGIDAKLEASVDQVDAAAVIKISAREHRHIEQLESKLAQIVQGELSVERDTTYMTNVRQKNLLEVARSDLQLAIDAAQAGATLDLIAVHLQSTYEELGLVIGEETGEDLLDEIFLGSALVNRSSRGPVGP
ncbi:tRNA modification GTPase MnmE [Alicyclobacillus fastidiosus]|nr:tRNA modification GTPase MnmE [Alicyclobacillus fastidiosus]